jgi:predicted nucleic acid-binding protein
VLLPLTSVWVDYLRRGGGELDAALGRGEIAICGPVAAELLAGVRAADRPALEQALRGLDWLDLDREAWLHVGALAAELRAAGRTVPLTDVEIAVAAIRANATVWTTDSDFQRIAEVADGLALRR